jgi:hypothetical protein
MHLVSRKGLLVASSHGGKAKKGKGTREQEIKLTVMIP